MVNFPQLSIFVAMKGFNELEGWLNRVASGMMRIWAEHRVGILATVAFHLLVLVVLLACKLESSQRFYGSEIELAFEPDEPELEEVPEPERPLLPADALVAQREVEAVRNFAVDATERDLNAGLKDEKNIDADELYREAERVKAQMEQNRELYESVPDEVANIPNTPQTDVPEAQKAVIDAPTVVSYNLKGRKAIAMPKPAYMCQGGGQVVVNIMVNAAGKVIKAEIDAKGSVIEECINSEAVKAANNSLFTPSDRASQSGSITYLFVAQ